LGRLPAVTFVPGGLCIRTSCMPIAYSACTHHYWYCLASFLYLWCICLIICILTTAYNFWSYIRIHIFWRIFPARKSNHYFNFSVPPCGTRQKQNGVLEWLRIAYKAISLFVIFWGNGCISYPIGRRGKATKTTDLSFGLTYFMHRRVYLVIC
jgi:hypothetical protein